MPYEVASSVADVSYRQAIMPVNMKAEFLADDTDNHDIRVAARGKLRLTVAVDNPSNKDATVVVHGLSAADGAVGDAGTFEVIASDTCTAGGKLVKTSATKAFAWYLVRVSFAATPDGSTVTVDANLAL